MARARCPKGHRNTVYLGRSAYGDDVCECYGCARILPCTEPFKFLVQRPRRALTMAARSYRHRLADPQSVLDGPRFGRVHPALGRHQMIMRFYAVAAHHAAACTDSHYWGTSEACQWHLARVDFARAEPAGLVMLALLILVIVAVVRGVRTRRGRR